ncbi:hypothetical protein EYF80_026227 [Liparis tanakae]|uniref:Uncharacterized protein n=1 Tax=Liparis tanakae TaxID=230148 RepID=A0A4Z2HE66_9TELE|nr:hypothetical protein EYF80_026227 [Liparis tanakae]
MLRGITWSSSQRTGGFFSPELRMSYDHPEERLRLNVKRQPAAGQLRAQQKTGNRSSSHAR